MSEPTSTDVLIKACLKANVPPILWGPPGVAKTATITALMNHKGWPYEVVIGSTRLPEDFIGLPFIGPDKVTERAVERWAKSLYDAASKLDAEGDTETLVVGIFDELTTCPPAVQDAMLRVFEERWVGELKMPERVRWIAMANPVEIVPEGWPLKAPASNRFCHIKWNVPLETWIENMLSGFTRPPSIIDAVITEATAETISRARGLVAGFLKAQPNHADSVPTNPADAGKAWPSRRSWTMLIKLLAHIPASDDGATLLAAVGCVGDATGAAFMAWMRTAGLPNARDVIADPGIVNWKDEEADRLFAMLAGVEALYHEDKTLKMYNDVCAVYVACAEGHRPDVATPFVRRIVDNTTRPKGASIPADVKRAFSEILKKMGRLV